YLIASLIICIFDIGSIANEVEIYVFQRDDRKTLNIIETIVCYREYTLEYNKSYYCIECPQDKRTKDLIINSFDIKCAECPHGYEKNETGNCILSINENKSGQTKEASSQFEYPSEIYCKTMRDLENEDSVPITKLNQQAVNCRCEDFQAKVVYKSQIICLDIVENSEFLKFIDDVLEINKQKIGYYYLIIDNNEILAFKHCIKGEFRSKQVLSCLCNAETIFENMLCIKRNNDFRLIEENQEIFKKSSYF
ncbi:MAG: hypothetical protein MHPSP_003362, partial [Paramarteilia canceri]